jgi:phage-related minor tail protein
MGPNDSDTNIEVSLTAEFSDLQRGMTAGTEVVQAESAAMTEAVTAAATEMAAVQQVIGESAEAASARIHAMVEASMAAAQAEIASAAAAREQAAATAELVAITDVQADELARLQAAQNRSMAQTSAILAQERAQAAAAAETTAATEAQTAATAELGVVTGAVAREMGVLAGEAARGNWTRLEGSTITLANRMNLLQLAFTPVGLGLTALAAGAGIVVAEFIRAEERASRFEAALLSTGYAAGLSAGDLENAAAQVAAVSGNANEADDVIQKLASSGRLAGDALINGGIGASNIMRLTGESADEAARQVASLGDDPARAVVELNNKFHFLTAEVYDHIVSLQQAGDAYGATEAAAKAFAENTTERVEQLNEKMGFFEGLLQRWKSGVSNIDHGLQKAFDPTLADRYQEAAKKYFEAKEMLDRSLRDRPDSSYNSELAAIVEKRRQEAYALQEQIRQEQELAKQKGDAARRNAETIQAEAAQNKLNESLKYTSQLEAKIAEEKERVELIHKNNPSSESIKGITFDASGAVAGGEQWHAIVQKLSSAYSNTASAARDARRAAQELVEQGRKDTEAVLQSLEQKRAATKEFSKERLAADQEIVTFAQQIYGQDSSQYSRALNQKLSDERAYAQQQRRIQTERLQATRDEASGEIDTKKAQYEADYQAGQINAGQLLQLERQLITEKLALDLQYLKAKQALDKGDELELAKDQSAIVQAKERSNQAMARADQQYHRNLQTQWRQSATRIEGAMAGAANSMLFQGQTLKNSMLSVAETIAETFIQKAIEWAGTELTQNTVVATTKVETQGAAARLNIAADAASAAAGAFAATAAIPYVGPALAPAAAATAYSETMAFQAAIPSAAGGWGQVPADTLANIHKDEMVLPADLATGIRSMIASGKDDGSNGGATVIQAQDARSFREWSRRHPKEFASAMKFAQQRGHLGGKKR